MSSGPVSPTVDRWFGVPLVLRDALLAVPDISEAIGQRLHYQELRQQSQLPHVWFARDGWSETETALCPTEYMPREHRFSLEIVSDTDAEQLVGTIAEALRQVFMAAADDSSEIVQMIQVEDASDDYVFRSVGESEPNYLHALTVVAHVVKD